MREAVVGRTRFASVTLDATEVASLAGLATHLRHLADPDQVLDLTLTGVAERWLDIDPAALSSELADAFLAVRLRDESHAAAPGTTDAAPGTTDAAPGSIERTFRDTLAAHIAAAEASGDALAAADARAAYQLGRQLLDDPRQVGLI